MEIILFLVVCVFIALFLSNLYYLKVELKNSQEYFIKQVIHKKSDCYSFGSAYCRFGLDFEAAGYPRGYNLGFGSQFFYYTDKMLRKYTKLLPEGGTVFIICADLVFAEEGKGLYGAQRYCLFLDKEDLGDEWRYSTYIKEAVLPCFFHPYRNVRVMKHLFCNFFNLNTQRDNLFTQSVNLLSEDEVKNAAYQRCKDWCDQFGLKNTETDEISPTLVEKFEKTRRLLTGMIQYCLDRQLQPILVVTPVSEHLNNLLSEKFIKKVLYDNIHQANVQNVPFLDYLKDPRFQDSKYYINSDMMNAVGRKLFTEILMKDAKLLNIKEH